MRSWGNREDTVVVDEPFYAHYLEATGLEHPGRDEVIASQPTDWRKVAGMLHGAVPGHAAIYYQKQMSHHLLPDMGREWLDGLTHAFLIRDPRPMIVSLGEKLSGFELEATGLPQQVEIFDHVVKTTGRIPPVIDSADLLARPEPTLRALCAALGVPFSDRMLWWPAGPRDTDGVWARYWYDRVEKSTGFETPPAAGRTVELSPRAAGMEARCRPLYERLHEHSLRA
jgi:hypothetical protein